MFIKPNYFIINIIFDREHAFFILLCYSSYFAHFGVSQYLIDLQLAVNIIVRITPVIRKESSNDVDNDAYE